MFHRESDAAKLARNRDVIFSLQAEALAWMEEYTGIRYPFGKFDFVLVPAFQFGGMEHPGAVYYRDASLLLDETATQAQRLGRASLIAHETAHMWFGDLVTMEWFDDVWTKEVFANFMAAKIVNPAFPEVDHDLRFFLSHHPAAYEIDRSAGANPIRQELDNLLDAGSLYGAIIYDKAPIVMEHLERTMGEAAFRNGLRAYLGEFAYGNATWPELIAILDRRTQADLAAWSRVWVEEPGRPTIRATLARAEDGARTIRVEQHDPAGLGRVWPERLGIRVGAGDSVRALGLDLAGPSATVAVPPTWPLIEWLLPNGDGVAYGWFRLDPSTRAALLAGLETLPEPLLRGVAWVTLWDALLAGDIAPATLIELAIRAVPVESAELNVQRMLGDAGTAFWRFLDAAERERVAPRLEEMLWEGMLHAPAPTLQAAYFQAFERLALTDAAVRRLEGLWSGELEVEGLELSEQDRTRLAFALAVRGVPDAARILDVQAGAIENPDRRRRFDFIRPALSADSAARGAFFAGLADPENRAHEAWVVDAVGWLHHPLRAASAVPFILPALELVEEIQRTGDIFFPKRWLDATLGGHASPEAAAIVRAFLDGRPDYPPKLRQKILQSADELFRAAAIRDRRTTSPRHDRADSSLRSDAVGRVLEGGKEVSP
ncbi:MAG: M1 family aminopeptidase, partial [Longimicrobiales bacterium]